MNVEISKVPLPFVGRLHGLAVAAAGHASGACGEESSGDLRGRNTKPVWVQLQFLDLKRHLATAWRRRRLARREVAVGVQWAGQADCWLADWLAG